MLSNIPSLALPPIVLSQHMELWLYKTTSDNCKPSILNVFTMVHTIRTHANPTYEELQATGMFSTDANCSQYLLDVKILPTKRRCSRCPDHDRMVIKPCSTAIYKDGCCWQCPKGHTTSLKAGSVLQNSNLPYGDFILILSSFAEGLTVTRTAERASVAETTVRRIFHTIRQQMAEDNI